MFFSKINTSNFKIAMYIRLSREDGDKAESESIGNQRDIIKRYINENELQFINEYVDDGMSGTSFNRPGFNNMIKNIEEGKINMVITKDLSRLGRDYIKTGYYLENYFPEHNVRFVAINDGIDTFMDSTCNDITPFKSIMNDMYAKDISKKIRSVRKEKQKKGEYVCTVAPYGYKKDPNQKNHLIVDENVRNIVEEIFEIYANGNGTKYIAQYLNKKNIPSPLTYTRNLSIPKKWNDVTILNMMKNEVYIGNTVGNKKTKLSYKSNKRIIMPIENHIITENTHEAIVSMEIYDKIKFYLDNRAMSKKTKHYFLFRRLLVCKTCGRKLSIGSKSLINGVSIDKLIPYISCSGSQKGKCESQHMNYKKFETEILKHLKDFCKLYADKEFLKDIYNSYEDTTSLIIHKYQKEINNIDNKKNTMSEQIDNIYFDKINKVISEDDYFRYSNKIICEREALEKRKLELVHIIKDCEIKKDETSSNTKIDEIITEFMNLEDIPKELLYKLIEKIEIDDKKNVYIYFTFSKLNIINESISDKINFKEISKNNYTKEKVI